MFNDLVLLNIEAKVRKLDYKVKALQKKVIRQKKKIHSLKDVIADLKDKRLIGLEPAEFITNTFTGIKLGLFENELRNKDKTAKGCRYSDSLKEFAMTMHYYSPQAYRYLRTQMKLPAESSLRNWLLSIECSTGIIKSVLEHLSTKGEAERDFSLVIDSMAIRKQSVYDPSCGTFKGYCDYGKLVCEDPEKLASEALVFLLVPLKSSMQYPIGYFLVDKVNADIQSQLVTTALRLTADHGLTIHNITFDGASANISTAQRLGVDLPSLPEKPSFKHPQLESDVYISLDACHMLKLARNALAELKVIFNADGGAIEWKYIQMLGKIQDEEGLHLAN